MVESILKCNDKRDTASEGFESIFQDGKLGLTKMVVESVGSGYKSLNKLLIVDFSVKFLNTSNGALLQNNLL